MKRNLLAFFIIIAVLATRHIHSAEKLFDPAIQQVNYVALKNFLKDHPKKANLCNIKTKEKELANVHSPTTEITKYFDLLDFHIYQNREIYIDSYSCNKEHPLVKIKNIVSDYRSNINKIACDELFNEKTDEIKKETKKNLLQEINNLCTTLVENTNKRTKITHGPFPKPPQKALNQLELSFFDTLLHRKNIKVANKNQYFLSDQKTLFFVVQNKNIINPTTIAEDPYGNYFPIKLGQFACENAKKILDINFNEKTKRGAFLYSTKQNQISAKNTNKTKATKNYHAAFFSLKRDPKTKKFQGTILAIFDLPEKPIKITQATTCDEFAIIFENRVCVYKTQDNTMRLTEEFKTIPTQNILKIEYKLNNSCIVITYNNGSTKIIRCTALPENTVSIAESIDGSFAAIATEQCFFIYKVKQGKNNMTFYPIHQKNIKKGSIKTVLCGTQKNRDGNSKITIHPVVLVYKNNNKLHKYTTDINGILQRPNKSQLPTKPNILTTNQNCSLVALLNDNIIQAGLTNKQKWSSLFLSHTEAQDITFYKNQLLVCYPNKFVIHGRADKISFITYLFITLLQKSGGSFAFSKKIGPYEFLKNLSWLEFYLDTVNQELTKLEYPNKITIENNSKMKGEYIMRFTTSNA